jgi:hypothetical protein
VDVLIGFAMAASISMVAFGALIGIIIDWWQSQRGRRRAGKRCRVRSQRTYVSSRGQRPYRGGRVRVN